MKKKQLLGILGGLGPMSSAYFYELLTAHTDAKCDADHIDLLISSRASTPDRTAFILGASKESPIPAMREEINRLVCAGATLLVIPCNTAHTFYEELQRDCPVPILNIISQSVKHLQRQGVTKFGLLATEGTVASGSYQHFCSGTELECVLPSPEEQAYVTEIIYDQIKQNKPVDMDKFYAVTHSLIAQGCQRLVLGCTELSLLKKQGLTDTIFVDSLEVLAHATILASGKTPCDFPASFSAEAGGVL